MFSYVTVASEMRRNKDPVVWTPKIGWQEDLIARWAESDDKCTKTCGGERDSMQCMGTTLRNERCKLRTARGDMCWIHLQSDYGLRVKDSQYGLGLFATEDFAKGDEIAPYRGEVVSHRKINQLCPGDDLVVYGLQITAKEHVNACKTTDGVARFANDPHGSDKEPNAEFPYVNKKRKNLPKKLMLTAVKPIKKGEEVLVDYGEDYWQ